MVRNVRTSCDLTDRHTNSIPFAILAAQSLERAIAHKNRMVARKFILQHDRGTLRTCEREQDVGTG
jgi:hypothetical protein